MRKGAPWAGNNDNNDTLMSKMHFPTILQFELPLDRTVRVCYPILEEREQRPRKFIGWG